MPHPITESRWKAKVLADDGGRSGLLFTRNADGSFRTRQRSIQLAEEAWVGEFARLSTGHDGEIRRFAGRYGPLYICRHGLPVTHLPRHTLRYLPPEEQDDHYWAYLGDRLSHFESFVTWRHFATQAAAIIEASGLLRNVEPFNPEEEARDWQRLAQLWPTIRPLLDLPDELDDTGVPVRATALRTAGAWHRALGLAVQRWLDWGDVRSHFEWGTDGPALRWSADTLFGALALQLSITVSSSSNLSMCSHCHEPFFARRRRRSGENSYCDEMACKNACQAAYQRRRRAKLRTKGESSV